MDINIIDLTVHGDSSGKLVAIEEFKDVPFDVKRVYYIYDTESGVIRGKHAHKKLKQVLLCVHGKCTIRLDNGEERKEIQLDDPKRGIMIEGMIWREMLDFSNDAVLVVLASEPYDESDYIRDYDTFLTSIRGK